MNSRMLEKLQKRLSANKEKTEAQLNTIATINKFEQGIERINSKDLHVVLAVRYSGGSAFVDFRDKEVVAYCVNLMRTRIEQMTEKLKTVCLPISEAIEEIEVLEAAQKAMLQAKDLVPESSDDDEEEY